MYLVFSSQSTICLMISSNPIKSHQRQALFSSLREWRGQYFSCPPALLGYFLKISQGNFRFRLFFRLKIDPKKTGVILSQKEQTFLGVGKCHVTKAAGKMGGNFKLIPQDAAQKQKKPAESQTWRKGCIWNGLDLPPPDPATMANEGLGWDPLKKM